MLLDVGDGSGFALFGLVAKDADARKSAKEAQTASDIGSADECGRGFARDVVVTLHVGNEMGSRKVLPSQLAPVLDPVKVSAAELMGGGGGRYVLASKAQRGIPQTLNGSAGVQPSRRHVRFLGCAR